MIKTHPLILFELAFRQFKNTIRSNPLQYIFISLLLIVMYWGIHSATIWGLDFLDKIPNYDAINLVDAVIQRSLESLLMILMFSVAFSVLTTAVQTLYDSHDLPFLLSLPIKANRVFYMKVSETYTSAAMLPAFFTLPILVAIGIHREAGILYYFVAIASVLALYAIPVAIGSLVALVLMRFAPAGKVKEVATGLSVIFAAALVFGLRLLRPEQIATMSPLEMIRFLKDFAEFKISWMPSSWTSEAIWAALDGRFGLGAFFLLAISVVSLWVVAQLAALAYSEGWIRSNDSIKVKLDPRVRPMPFWERQLLRLHKHGHLIAKDIRLMLRDPSQWSQLLVLVALAGVYLVSISSITIEGSQSQRYRDAVATLNIAFTAFLLSGVGIRMTYPSISLEGEGFWILRTGPLSSRELILSKFWHSLPSMIILGGGLGFLATFLMKSSSTLSFVSPIAGLCAGMVITGLGVGLGAAFPKFDANSPSEIPMAAGGLLYIAFSLCFAIGMTALIALPAWRTIQNPNIFYWSKPQGMMILAILLVVSCLATALPLLFGSYKLSRFE